MTFTQELRKIGAGRTATIFLYGHDRVIKLFKSTFPHQAINEEFEIGHALRLSGLRIPKTYEIVEVGHLKGILQEFIEGRSMLQNLASKPWLVLRYAKKMANAHFKIHMADFKGNKCIKPLRQSIADRISRASLLTSEEKAEILSGLSLLRDGSSLCHGDFHPDNIIMSKNGPVTVDWITARVGNPSADVARTWLLLRMGTLPENKSRFEIFLAKSLRNIFCYGYIRGYKKLSSLSSDQFEEWKLPVAAARLIENVSDRENQDMLRFIRRELRKAR